MLPLCHSLTVNYCVNHPLVADLCHCDDYVKLPVSQRAPESCCSWCCWMSQSWTGTSVCCGLRRAATTICYLGCKEKRQTKVGNVNKKTNVNIYTGQQKS